MSMLEYRQLEALGAVIEQGGFDKAAEFLGLTQSAVTQRVKQLETWAGKPLVVRSNPPVPTDAGLPLYTHFRKIRLLEEDLQQVSDEGISGTSVSLGVNASTLGSWFLPALSRIMRSVLVDLHVGEANIIHQELQLGRLAGCISIRSKASRGCSVEYLGNLVLRCVAGSRFQQQYFPRGIEVEAMKSTPVVLFHPESQMLRMFQKSVMEVVPFDVPAHIIPSQNEYLQLISDGAAYGFLPEPLFIRYREEKGLVDLSPASPIALPQYWHHWGIESEILEFITYQIRDEAKAGLRR